MVSSGTPRYWFGVTSAVLLFTLPATLARASEPIGQLGFEQDSVQIIGSQGSGTGDLIGDAWHHTALGNELDMCFVTADHVLRGSNSVSIGWQGMGAVNPGAFRVGVGNGNAFAATWSQDGSADCDFVGVQVKWDSLTAAQQRYLWGQVGAAAANGRGANAVTPQQVAAANPTAGTSTFSEWGYGRSGTPDANFPAFAYVWHQANANEQYGTQRQFSNTIQTANIAFTNAYHQNGGPYTYTAMNWTLRTAATGAIPGEGQGNSGDSGGAIFMDGKIEGVLTNVWGDGAGNIYTNAARTLEGFKAGAVVYSQNKNNAAASAAGSEGLAVQFTAADANFLNNRCMLYTAAPVPELSTSILMAGCLGGLFLAQWKRRRS